MSRALPFTQHSIARAIRGIEKAGKFAIGVKPDGTLIIGDKPVDVASLVPTQLEQSLAQERRFSDYLEPSSKWEDKRADELYSSAPARRFGERTLGTAAQSEELAKSPRAFGISRAEWEESVRKSPMGKRETTVLGAFFRTRSEPATVKGGGFQVTSRLVARGYIEVIESSVNKPD